MLWRPRVNFKLPQRTNCELGDTSVRAVWVWGTCECVYCTVLYVYLCVNVCLCLHFYYLLNTRRKLLNTGLALASCKCLEVSESQEGGSTLRVIEVSEISTHIPASPHLAWPDTLLANGITPVLWARNLRGSEDQPQCLSSVLSKQEGLSLYDIIIPQRRTALARPPMTAMQSVWQWIACCTVM